MNQLSRQAATHGQKIGFVPTMGWLHAGHLSLVAAARERCDRVILSVFVNPTQFGPNEDYSAYPRDIERDAKLAREAGVDWLFTPSVTEIYPDGHRTFVEVGGLGERLCGRSRPGHFRGVATVVAKLLAAVDADAVFLGQKDHQQLVVLRRMAADLLMRTEVVGCPIVREADGLAMSSRNQYLVPDERRAATVLSRALFHACDAVARGERRAREVIRMLVSEIESEPLARIDYVEVVDPDHLEPVEDVATGALAVLAVFLGRTRLIDNALLSSAASIQKVNAC